MTQIQNLVLFMTILEPICFGLGVFVSYKYHKIKERKKRIEEK